MFTLPAELAEVFATYQVRTLQAYLEALPSFQVSPPSSKANFTYRLAVSEKTGFKLYDHLVRAVGKEFWLVTPVGATYDPETQKVTAKTNLIVSSPNMRIEGVARYYSVSECPELEPNHSIVVIKETPL